MSIFITILALTGGAIAGVEAAPEVYPTQVTAEAKTVSSVTFTSDGSMTAYVG